MRQQTREEQRGLCLPRLQEMGNIKDSILAAFQTEQMRRKWKLVLFLHVWPSDLPAWCEATTPTIGPVLFQGTREQHSCGLQRHLADVTEKWHQNTWDILESFKRQAPNVLSVEVIVNKQVSVLEKFTIHLGRQSQVLEEIYASIWGTGRSEADLLWGLGKGYTEEAAFKPGLKRWVIICQAVKDGRNFQAVGLETQRPRGVKDFSAFREGWNIQITSQQQLYWPAGLTALFLGKEGNLCSHTTS